MVPLGAAKASQLPLAMLRADLQEWLGGRGREEVE